MSSRISDLEARLEAVERRLGALEGVVAEPTTEQRKAAEPTLDDGTVGVVSAHIGRVLLIFGGAYLLRAITDFEFVPKAIGILIGAVYAVSWLVIGYRKSRFEAQRTSAAIYSGTSVVLALPLLLEAVTKFMLLSGTQAILGLVVYNALAYFVAIRRQFRSLAWLATAGSIAVATGVLVASHSAVAVALFVIALGFVALWTVYRMDWLALQWLAAIGANAGVMMLVALSNTEQWSISPRLAFLFGVLLLFVYLGSFIVRTHRQAGHINIFEVVQTVLMGVVVGWSAANAVSAGQLAAPTAGLIGIVLGVLTYGLALTPQSRLHRNQNFFYYQTLGLLLMLVGSAWLLPLGMASMLWAVAALVAAFFSGRTGWVNLSLQSTLLVFAAGVGSGLLATGLDALAGDPLDGWPGFRASHLLIALATVACLFIPVAQRSARWGSGAGLPQVIVLAFSVWEVGGLFVAFAAPWLAEAGTAEPDLSVLAALRTAVLAVASVTLALSSRYPRWPEARWLVYPVLILVAIKLTFEDFPHGQPATLFVALGFVGSALLLVARFLKRDTAPADGA